MHPPNPYTKEFSNCHYFAFLPRWTPFRRSAYLANRSIKLEPEDKKFFAALIKPRASNYVPSFGNTDGIALVALYRKH